MVAGTQFVDKDGYKIRCGCVPYRVTPDGLMQVMVVSSGTYADRWVASQRSVWGVQLSTLGQILPAGTVEDGQQHDLPQVAVRETHEEAGATGAVRGLRD